MKTIPASIMAQLSTAVLAAAGLMAGTALAQTQPQAILLREIKDLDRLDPNWIMGMCNLPGLACNKVEVPRLYSRKGDQGLEYYAVMEDLVVARLVMKAPGQWQLLNRWDFANYPLPSASNTKRAKLEIHPALYPVGFGLWGIALLNSTMESYSGGGAEFVTADFVTLDPEIPQIAEAQRRFGNVPFSCTKTVRACFTEKEYKRSPHCHDESQGSLTLKYSITPESRYYDWTATWHETSWPAGVAQSAEKTTRTTFALKPGPDSGASDAFAFCDGGPAGQ